MTTTIMVVAAMAETISIAEIASTTKMTSTVDAAATVAIAATATRAPAASMMAGLVVRAALAQTITAMEATEEIEVIEATATEGTISEVGLRSTRSSTRTTSILIRTTAYIINATLSSSAKPLSLRTHLSTSRSTCSGRETGPRRLRGSATAGRTAPS